MKGAPGLIVALLFGGLGIALNYLYLYNKGKDVESMSFLGVSEGTAINPGDAFREDMFTEVKIPLVHAGNLKDFNYQFKDRSLISGTKATKAYKGGELVRLEDYRTPPAELKLTKGQLLIWVAVDDAGFVPDLVDPGDKVTFIVPVYKGPVGSRPAPNVNQDDGGGATESVMMTAESETIGPFVVATIGSRLGSSEVSKANRIQSSQGHQIGIVIQNIGTDDAPKFEPRATQLLERIKRSPNLRVGVAVHARDRK